MSWKVRAGAIGVVLAGLASEAVGDTPPPLAAPVLTAPATPATPALTEPPRLATSPTRASSAIPESRPVLVVPGVTAPGRVRTPSATATAPPPDLVGAPRELPEFDIPKEMLEPQPREIPRVTPPAGSPPPVVESTPGARTPVPASRGIAASRPGPGENGPRTAARPAPPDPARRPPGLFGRFFTPPSSSPSRRGPAVTVEPRADPAADAALQRRVERQIRETLADRVRAYEVRVVDRNVVVRARVTRFWQKRSVRHALETLPSLDGYHARVEVVE